MSNMWHKNVSDRKGVLKTALVKRLVTLKVFNYFPKYESELDRM